MAGCVPDEGGSYAGSVHLGLIALVVSEYDPAISFFVDEPYGHVAVFLDVAGNKWDLIGPAS